MGRVSSAHMDKNMELDREAPDSERQFNIFKEYATPPRCKNAKGYKSDGVEEQCRRWSVACR